FTSLLPVKEGTVLDFDITPRMVNDKFGFVFEGYIEISEAGEYTFYTTSDDGSALFINDQIVVDNDGLHAEQEKSGTLTLEKGKHAIRATFFEKTGKEVFNVSYE